MNFIAPDGLRPTSNDQRLNDIYKALDNATKGRSLTANRFNQIDKNSNAEMKVIPDEEMDRMQDRNGLGYREGLCAGYSKTKQIVYFRSSIFSAKSPTQIQGLMLHELTHTLQHINNWKVNEALPEKWQKDFSQGN